ncbi:Gfo/Idh/MocA family protein [Clostridium sp. UBA4548]|uniref:Gfo/Idh/MocA family protein n=1 Tax=Clostridium sp. UBA4548 TaxID=1946361 RepID=UPI0025BFCE01|nr:Gfo/Idh/MocA family oxidoreductase [Clostridium sp. UBA4548]
MRKFRIGIIGAGMRAIFLMNEILERKELQVVALSDVSEYSMNQLCNKFDQQWHKYKNYQDLLAREDIEGVIILSPDYVHEEQAVAAFQAGKHVFLEKPIAITIEGGKRVIEARDKSGKILLVGFVLRYNKAYRKMKELIDSGIIGEVKTGWVLHSVGSGSDWYFHDWHGSMKNTGGLLLQKGSHDLDMINWIVNSKVKRIVALGSQDLFGGDKSNDLVCQKCEDRGYCSEAIVDRNISWKRPDGKGAEVLYNQWRNQCVYRKEVDVLDNHLMLLDYESGVKVSYMECHYTPEDNREYIFIGTKGKLKLDDSKDLITIQLRNSIYDREEKTTFENLQMSEGHGGGDKHIIDDFIQGLKTGKQPKVGGEAGLKAIEIGIVAQEVIAFGEDNQFLN